MTCDERIEALLNRAGQTISDLPKGNPDRGAYPGKKSYAMTGTMHFEQIRHVSDVDILDCLDYILHLTDVIDRFETALENVTGERDYLLEMAENSGVESCQLCPNTEECEREGRDGECTFGMATVPHYVRVDDA